MNFHILTLFPEMVMGGLNTSITGRAIDKGLISVEACLLYTSAMNDTVRLALLRLKMQSTRETPTLPRVDDSGNIKGEVKGFVFLNNNGNVWSEPPFRELIARITKRYNKEAEKMGKEKIEVWKPHQSRHSYTSLAYSVGADMKAVSHMLGHASINTTLDVYADLSEEKKKEQEAVIKAVRIS